MLKEQTRTMLEERLIPFWSTLRDDEFGGFYGYMGYGLDLDKKAEKGCILNSRILWFFSRCAQQLDREDCWKNAEHAFRFLMDHCLDRDRGGVYWSLNYDGTVLDDSKHTYAQSFAIYGLSAYYEATHDREALSTAKSLFRVIESKCRDEGGIWRRSPGASARHPTRSCPRTASWPSAP